MENKLFPFTDPSEFKVGEKEIPLAREYDYDFKKGEFKLKDGKLYIVEGKEAVKIWIIKAILTRRYKEIIHSWHFGSEIEDKIIGKGYTNGLIKSETERYIREAISASLSDYIVEVSGFDIGFDDSTLKVSFEVKTIYGEVNVVV